MIRQEQHMKIIENQRNIYEHITERPVTMESQRQFCQHSKLLYFLAGTFGPCFFRVFHLQRGRKQETIFKILLPSWFWHVLIVYFQGDAF